MCDNNPVEECFKSLVEKEIIAIEDESTADKPIAVIFPALSAKLRFLFHNILHNHPALQTVSVGIEPNRHPIVFISNQLKDIIDVPEGQVFSSKIKEFAFRTGQSDIFSFTQPFHDFNLFVSTVNNLAPTFLHEYPFVTVSQKTKYIDIRRALRTYYRQGLVNCYEVKEGEQSDHIIITNSKETLDQLIKSFSDELGLVQLLDLTGCAANVLHVMAKCGQLTPAKPRTLVDRSAAANIMSRHLGIGKNSNKRPIL